jgi:hypothetical protein
MKDIKKNKINTPSEISKEKVEKENTISFEYKISPNYLVHAVSGVHGGLTPKGEIVMNVFFERHPIPKRIVHEIESNGTLGKEIERDQKHSIIRDVLLGLSLTPDLARLIAKWLNKRADEVENLISIKEEKGS